MTKMMLAIVLTMIMGMGFAQDVHRCDACQGYGAVVCPTCHGFGQISSFDYFWGCYVNHICPQCYGAKAVVCGKCMGTGTVTTYNPNFVGKQPRPSDSNRDGYIYQGKTVKVGDHYYKYYRKKGHGYYWNGFEFIPYD